MYDVIEKRLAQALTDTENITPSIRELSRELGCNNRVIRTRFVKLAGALILKRKAEIRNMNNRKSIAKAIVGENEVVNRKCLSCDIQFVATNRFTRMCELCRKREMY